MKFLRRIAGIFGLLKDESHEEAEEDDEDNINNNRNRNRNHHHHQNNSNQQHPRGTTTGFSVQVPVTVVDRPHPAPLLTLSNHRDGGVQGLRWYAKRLRIDEDGDVADEFLEEVLPEVVEMPSNTEEVRPITRFEVKYRARPAKVRMQTISGNGKVQHSVEHQGKLLLV